MEKEDLVPAGENRADSCELWLVMTVFPSMKMQHLIENPASHQGFLGPATEGRDGSYREQLTKFGQRADDAADQVAFTGDANISLNRPSRAHTSRTYDSCSTMAWRIFVATEPCSVKLARFSPACFEPG
jgi:hypothetical protein